MNAKCDYFCKPIQLKVRIRRILVTQMTRMRVNEELRIRVGNTARLTLSLIYTSRNNRWEEIIIWWLPKVGDVNNDAHMDKWCRWCLWKLKQSNNQRRNETGWYDNRMPASTVLRRMLIAKSSFQEKRTKLQRNWPDFLLLHKRTQWCVHV